MTQPESTWRLDKAVGIAIILVAILLVGYIKFGYHHTSANSSDDTDVSPDAQLQKIIDDWVGQQSFTTAVEVRTLTGTGRSAGASDDTRMTTASTYKIFVAYAVLHDVEQHKYTVKTTISTGETVRAALNNMILKSDNDSAEALGVLAGWNHIDSLAAQAGATHTDLNNYDSAGNITSADKQTSAADLTLMLTKLQSGKLLSASDTSLLLGLMKNQIWRERIPAGVPSGIAVADKPGWLSNVQNDAAIVYGPKSTYVLVVMTSGSSTQPLTDLSRSVYNYLEH